MDGSRDPFGTFCIADDAPLRACTERFVCPGCQRTALYYCCHCLCLAPALADRVPAARLPFRRLIVVKDVREHDSKSTALHAKIVAPAQVDVVAYSRDDPEPPAVLRDLDPAHTAVLFPSPGAAYVSETSFALACGCEAAPRDAAQAMSPVSTVIVIDGTWRQARAMARSAALSRFTRFLQLDARPGGETLFWRYQSVGPHCLATIEAIHRLCAEAECRAHASDAEHIDNLLFFFAFFYRRIQDEYRSSAKRFTPRRGADYIRP